MKPLLIILSLIFTYAYSQVNINLQNNFGYTLVNVSEAMEIPEHSDITDEGLVQWNQFNYKGLVQILIQKGSVSYGPEFGAHRLYYWEEKYHTGMGYNRWRYGTIWTYQIGGIFRKDFANHYYYLTGINLQIFSNESGSTVGFPFAVGHELPVSNKFTIPIEFRIDVIFGNAVPTSVGGGIGLKFQI